MPLPSSLRSPPDPDDFELSDLENEAFLPPSNERTTTQRPPRRRPRSALTRWLPPRALSFVENLSRIKVMIIVLVAFVGVLAFLGWLNDGIRPVAVPRESVALGEELVAGFANGSVPEYVFRFAPLVFLEKSEVFYPSDLGIHLARTHPTVEFKPVDVASWDLNGLDGLNELGGEDVFLASTEGLETIPKYLHGQAPGKKTLQTEGAVSAVVIVVEKGDGIVDAFYMYFYSFNQGPSVYGHEIGDHLGDWEHNMVRFKEGTPTHIWYSQHEYGEGYVYHAPEKINGRPVVYSARGSHANYAFAGKHDLHDGNEAIPANLVFDYTSRGLLWDPTLSAYYYTYAASTRQFSPVPAAAGEEPPPVGYLYFNGRWGDEEFTDDMPGQSSFHGFLKFTSGPQGPWFKGLERVDFCLPSKVKCEARTSI